MKLGIDLDGVLFPFDQNFKEYCLKIGEDIPHDAKTETWDFFKSWGMSTERFIEICNQGVDDQFIFLEADPYPDSVETLRELHAQGHTIHIVTHRMFGSRSAHNTFDWLFEHKVPFESVTFSEDKTFVQVDVLIEDNITNCVNSLRSNIMCFLLKRPWNDEAPELLRLNDWDEFVREIEILDSNSRQLENAAMNMLQYVQRFNPELLEVVNKTG